ncbi:uncharacterized protein VTP21DRAFT_4117 [Calcarisporiella thermophila]|uniref:uncharacterized protein n=1 Tax=Calcarisporiella thermophila TaxID=911321 RepID=UPI003742BC4A
MPDLSTNSTWLDLLYRHPIFNVSEGPLYPPEDNTWPSLNISYEVSSIPCSLDASASAKVNAYDLQGKKARMTTSGEDLFVATGSQLRLLRLSEWKNAVESEGRKHDNGDWINQQKYKVLEIPDVTFTIQSLAVNPNGRLIALTGTKEIAVAVLPRGRSLQLDNTSCRTYTIGSFYHNADSSTRIAKVRWHPLSEKRSHLMVLTNDGVLRIYDVAKNIEEPETTLRFPASRRAGTFSVDSFREAVSFCIGNGTQDWGMFTVYVLMNTGEVYSMCPVLPGRCYIDRSHLQNLACLVRAKSDQISKLADQNPDDFEFLHQQYTLQQRWLDEVFSKLRQDELTIADIKEQPSEREVISPPKDFPYPIYLQGPYVLQSAIDDNDETEDDIEEEASDILSLETAPVGVVAVAYAGGRVNVYLEVERAEAMWNLDAIEGMAGLNEPELLTLSLYECVYLNGRATQQPKSIPGKMLTRSTTSFTVDGGDDEETKDFPVLEADPIYADIFYCYHSRGAHMITIKRWLDELADSMKSEDALKKFAYGKILSDIRCLVQTTTLDPTQSTPMIGFCIINDIYLGYSLLLLTSAYQFVGIKLSIRSSEKASDPPSLVTAIEEQLVQAVQSEPETEDLDHSEIPNDAHYISLLPLPPFKASLGGLAAPRQPRLVVPAPLKRELVVNEESLRFLAQTVERYRSEIHDIIVGGTAVSRRVELQVKEFKRQLGKILEGQRRIQSVRRRNEAIRERVRKVVELQSMLTKRADGVLQRLIEKHEPGISEHEEQWFKELHEAREKIRSEDGLEMKVRKMERALEGMKREIVANGLDSAPRESMKRRERLNQHQLDRVQGMLSLESRMIEEARLRMSDLETRLGTLSI